MLRNLVLILLASQLSITITQADPLKWVLDKASISGKKLSGSADGELAADPTWSDDVLSLTGKQHVSLPEKTARSLPVDSFSVSARVRVDQPHRWGGIATFSQDNGQYERGWILGYTNDHFSFKFSNGGRFTILTSSEAIPLQNWATITVTYDGKICRLYQNGRQVALANANGKVVLPDIPTPFVFGGYKDKDEYYPMLGALESVTIYRKALSPSEVKKLAGTYAELTFNIRPHLRFVSQDQAELRWHATAQGTATVLFGLDRKKLDQRVESTTQGQNHTVSLTGLLPARKYYYRIGMMVDGKRVLGRIHEFDTSLNYLPPFVSASVKLSNHSEAYLAHCMKAIEKQPAGYTLVLGVTDGELAMAIAKQSRQFVYVIDSDAKRLESLRQKAYAAGIYGRRITTFLAKDKLPVTGCIANLILSERALAGETIPLTIAEAKRVLRPQGGIIVLPQTTAAKRWGGGSLTKRGAILAHRRGKLPGAADWSHQYGTAANTTYTGEEMGGVSQAKDLRLQWLGRPGADFNIDRQPRVSAPLAVNGRLFHQGMNRIISLDTYNGAILWSMEIPDLRRLNVAHDCSNWCADHENLYLVVEETAWVIDAASGSVSQYLQIPTKMRSSHQWGFIAHEGNTLIGSSVKVGSNFKAFWGSSKWFDKVGSTLATTQVCSDAIFGYSKSNWKGNWSWSKGVIINSTISLKNGKLYFLENRHPKWKNVATGRISDRSLWLDLHAVCLDATTGKKRWESKLPPFKHLDASKGYIQSAYGLNSDDGYLTVFSESVISGDKVTGGHFVYHYFKASNGKLSWSNNSRWRHNHHGAHISHPVLVEGHVFTDPHTIRLSDGKVLSERLAHRQKCPTPVAWKNGYLFRGSAPDSGSITLVMWDKNQKKLSGWNRLRPNCWLNSLPTHGGLIMPEGGGGCSCGGWMETSVGFLPVDTTRAPTEKLSNK